MPALNKPVAPALPWAGMEYDHTYQDQLNRVFRLYFNQLDNTVGTLAGTRGGQYINNPYGAFQTTTSHAQTTINTPKHLPLDTTDYANGMYLVAGDGIHIDVPGMYNIQFSAQLTNSDTQAHDADFWIRKNGADAAYTASVVTIPGTHGGQPGYYVLAANFFLPMLAGDYFEFWWASNSLQTQVQTLPAITTPFTSPGAPGFVCTVSFVSSILP